MTGTFSSVHELLHHNYLKTGSRFAPYANCLLGSARSMLDRAKLTSNLARAQELRPLVDDCIGSQEVAKWDVLYGLLSECFEPIADDVMILSAFEMYAKSKLLRKRYVIHALKEPTDLRKEQKKRPVHVQTLRTHQRHGDDVTFNDFTLGIGELLKPQYLVHYPLSAPVRRGLDKVRSRRNLVHFTTGFAWDVDSNLLALVSFLNEKIPRHNGA